MPAAHAVRVIGVPVANIQCDEIWSWVFCKAKHQVRMGYEVKTWATPGRSTGIERDTKLIVAFHVGTTCRTHPQWTSMTW